MPRKRTSNKNSATGVPKLDESFIQAQAEVDAAEEEIKQACKNKNLQGLVTITKRLIRTTISMMTAAETYFQSTTERDNLLRNRITKVFHDKHLEGFGFTYREELEPADNLIMFVNDITPNMRDGRLYAHVIKKVLPTDDDALIAAAVRKAEQHSHEWPIPEEVAEVVNSEVDEILHNRD